VSLGASVFRSSASAFNSSESGLPELQYFSSLSKRIPLNEEIKPLFIEFLWAFMGLGPIAFWASKIWDWASNN